jgi:cell division septal protein FtsQ
VKARPAAPSPPTAAAWAVSRMAAVFLLFAASGLLYHLATSEAFRIGQVVVGGNQLLTAQEVERAAAVSGANIFWIRQAEVGRRLQELPAVEWSRVSASLPDRLHVRIAERTPVVIWRVGNTPYLVDHEGRVLGSSPTARPLPTIRDVGTTDLRPGSTVDAEAIATADRLRSVLSRTAGTAPREFEYSAETGVTAVTDAGLRVRFGDAQDLDWKVQALGVVRRELERTSQRAELIDLRFKDRPYVR